MADGSQNISTPPLRKSQVLKRLRDGELPQMVDWFDPVLLGKVGVRTVISATIGSYADQRPMQAMADLAESEDALVDRHDLSNLSAADPEKRLAVDADGSVWVDFIADLGDGFEATYAMAYLMAADKLDVATGLAKGDTIELKGSEVLIFGGDLAYPDATVKEYQDRCIQPYNLAFSTPKPTRKLFYIAGNHDWYDGLAAFTSVFCAARDRVSKGLGKQIGGWRCQQRRSYFAAKMPYDWWIWGIDVQLNESLDDAQRDYFDLMSERAKPGDRIILIFHAPLWLNEKYDIMQECVMLATKTGATIAAVLAGDLHHYSRYFSDAFGVHLITSGGGGAFMHPTHQLDRKIDVAWPVPTGLAQRFEDPSARPEFNRSEKEAGGEGGMRDYAEQHFKVNAAEPQPKLNPFAGGAFDVNAIDKTLHGLSSTHIYPSRGRSRWIAMKNIFMPFRNKKFAVLLGLIYFLYGWVYQVALPEIFSAAYVETTVNELKAAETVTRATRERAQVLQARARSMAAEPWSTADGIKAASDLARISGDEAKSAEKFADAVRTRLQYQKEQTDPKANIHGEALKRLNAEGWWGWMKAYIAFEVSPTKFFKVLINSPLFVFLLAGLWIALIRYADVSYRLSGLVRGPLKFALGTLHFLAHLVMLLVINVLAQELSGTVEDWMKHRVSPQFATGSQSSIVSFAAAYAATFYNVFLIANHFLVSVVVGGILGGMIVGIYWVLTSTIGGMHMDSFGALGLKGYKNFLKLRFQPDQLTIYSVGLDRVPGRRGWMEPDATKPQASHKPQLVPKRPLKPHLIEPPIVIKAARGLGRAIGT